MTPTQKVAGLFFFHESLWEVTGRCLAETWPEVTWQTDIGEKHHVSGLSEMSPGTLVISQTHPNALMVSSIFARPCGGWAKQVVVFSKTLKVERMSKPVSWLFYDSWGSAEPFCLYVSPETPPHCLLSILFSDTWAHDLLMWYTR